MKIVHAVVFLLAAALLLLWSITTFGYAAEEKTVVLSCLWLYVGALCGVCSITICGVLAIYVSRELFK